MLYELGIEFKSYHGESKDDTIEVSDISIGNIQKKLDNFTREYYDDGYDELDPRYFNISNFDYNLLKYGVVVVLNGCLSIYLSEVVGEY